MGIKFEIQGANGRIEVVMLTLKQTCGACPEQYDVFQGENLVGYMRLRHGYFYAQCHGETVYSCNPKGDGCFEYDEKDNYLNLACRAILSKLNENKEEKLFEIVYE